MSRILGLVLAGVLAVGVVVAIVASLRGTFSPQPVVTVNGVIGSEKQPFFQDPAVLAEFQHNGLNVKVDTAGSREMAAKRERNRRRGLQPGS